MLSSSNSLVHTVLVASGSIFIYFMLEKVGLGCEHVTSLWWLGPKTRTLAPWRQGFRHPTRNKCMDGFAQYVLCGVCNDVSFFTWPSMF